MKNNDQQPRNPKKILILLCNNLNINFCNEMLHWHIGARKTDGIWGEYWYKNLINSTGFIKYTPTKEKLPIEYKK